MDPECENLATREVVGMPAGWKQQPVISVSPGLQRLFAVCLLFACPLKECCISSIVGRLYRLVIV